MKHPLRGLLITQFFGAFNDNAWKLMIITLAMSNIMMMAGADASMTEADVFAQKQWQTTIGMVIFSLPMMLFSLPAGSLADRFSKRSVMIAMKWLELALMALATVLLAINPLGTVGPFVVLGLMGVQSALFGPSKYGILPELLTHEQLSAGNGLLQMWTMLAIIAGTALGPIFLGLGGSSADPHHWFTAAGPLGLVLLAGVGVWASYGIPKAPAMHSESGVIGTIREGWTAIGADRMLTFALCGTIIYWTLLSLLGQNVIVYTNDIAAGANMLGLSRDMLTGVPFAMFGLGLGIGAVVAGRISGGKIEHGLIPLGAGVFGVLTVVIGLWEPGFYGALGILIPLGFSAGFIVVPLAATLQWRAPADRRGAVIAVSAALDTGGVIVGSLLAYAMAANKLDTGGIFIAAGVLVLLATAWSLYLLPVAALRMVFVLLAHTVYRFRVIGREHVPQEGGALLTPNHVSLIDALLVLAVLDRPVRFIMHESYYNKWWLKPLAKAMGAIPISSTGGPRMILRAMKQAGDCLDAGDLVCIFPEGQISRTGAMNPFRRGMERIVKGRGAPIIPVYLDRVWGSMFSYQGGRYTLKIPHRVPYPITVAFGEAIPAGTPLADVRRAVLDLGERAWTQRRSDRRPLHYGCIRQARRGMRAMAYFDETRGAMSRIQSVAGAIALARALKATWGEDRFVGVLLPPSVAAALTNIALSVAGRTSVNLNYTAGQAGMTSAAKQAKLRIVITSRAFIEKAKLELPDGVELVYLEDIGPKIGGAMRFTSALLAVFAPVRWIERACGATKRVELDDLATIIFSSGSTGEPKGVMLSHYNLDANVEAAAQIFPVNRNDRMLGILPMFHSFGYMTLWLATSQGVGIVFHPNPLDPIRIGELIERHRVTMLIATPTFLQIYMRRCDPGQFASLRVVLTGAEKLPDRVADAFEQRFGIRPIEGYGATECSPVIAASTLSVRYPGVFQAGSKKGSVGQPLPGVTVRIVDADTHEPLGPNQPGMLLVKGPNLMQGYLGRDDLTDKAFRDGWYVTGDVAYLDDDGYLHITDRLSRFSKIGGEMVPHGVIEEALHDAAGADMQTFAVTAVPDEKKGERIVVLHTLSPRDIPALVEKLAERGLPNLFIPRPDQFIKVDQLPLLGTGKLDLRKVKHTAVQAMTGRKA